MGSSLCDAEVCLRPDGADRAEVRRHQGFPPPQRSHLSPPPSRSTSSSTGFISVCRRGIPCAPPPNSSGPTTPQRRCSSDPTPRRPAPHNVDRPLLRPPPPHVQHPQTLLLHRTLLAVAFPDEETSLSPSLASPYVSTTSTARSRHGPLQAGPAASTSATLAFLPWRLRLPAPEPELPREPSPRLHIHITAISRTNHRCDSVVATPSRSTSAPVEGEGEGEQ